MYIILIFFFHDCFLHFQMVEKFMKTSEAIYVKNLFQKKKDKV